MTQSLIACAPCETSVLTLQGFDKYGVGAHTSAPTTRLQKELGLKVIAPLPLPPCAAPTCISMCLQNMSAPAHDLYFLIAEANLLCCMQDLQAVIACSRGLQSLSGQLDSSLLGTGMVVPTLHSFCSYFCGQSLISCRALSWPAMYQQWQPCVSLLQPDVC